MVETYAFIGLGAMGYSMASNIRKKSSSTSTLVVYDVHQPTIDKFVAQLNHHGPITVATSPKNAADAATVVVSILPDSNIVHKVYLDSQTGVVASAPNPTRLVLECSTVDSQTARDIGTEAKNTGTGTFIDCPVSGGVPSAEAGTLSFMIGYSSPTPENPTSSRLHDALSLMGSPHKFFYCNHLGAGLAAKISNNYISCSLLPIIAEAMAIGIKSGIDKHLLFDVIKNSTGQSWMLENVCPVPGVVPHAPSSNNYKLGFRSAGMIKDLGLGVDSGELVGIEPKMAKAAIEIWKKTAEDLRCKDRDGSSVYLHIGGPINT